MKIAISSKGNNLNSDFDLRFGRAMYFCILDKNTGETRFLANKQMNANGGAGTKTAELMAELDVSKIISGDFGPKAKSLLEELNIQMIVLNDTNITIEEIINKFQN
jgi:predicted Fe-Mo cluster-binding NifX family protein